MAGNNNYPAYDVRSRDDERNREWLARDPEQRYDLPRPFRPRPVPEGQVERRYGGPIDTPATIATRHNAVLQAVKNFKTHCPDTARRSAEAGAAFTRHWEEARAAEREVAGAAGGGEAEGAQPETGHGATPGDAPEANPEDARPASIYVDDVAAAAKVKCDCAECSDEETPPPYPRRRSARGAASGVRRSDAAARPRRDWRSYRE